MRKQTTITIRDGERDLVFRITQLSAIQLELFLLKFAKILAKSGLLDAQFNAKNSTDVIAQVADLMLKNAPQALGNLDVDATSELMGDLISRCVEKIDGKLSRRMTTDEIEDVIETLPALFELQKETVKFNLNFLLAGNSSRESTSSPTAGITSSQKISLRSPNHL